MAVTVCNQPLLGVPGRNHYSRTDTSKHAARGSSNPTMSQKYEELLVNIIIPPKPAGMDPPSTTSGYNQEHQTEGNNGLMSLRSILSHEEDVASTKLPFVWKLHEMLDEVELNGQNDIVSWIDNGRGFKVHSMVRFVNDIVPKYFRQSKFKSFQRQLYFYGFKRITFGDDEGAYTHPNFVKGSKTLCLSMLPKKSNSKSRSSIGSNKNHNSHGDLYQAPNSNLQEWMPQMESLLTHGAKPSSLQVRRPPRCHISVTSDLQENNTQSVLRNQRGPSDGDTVLLFGGKPFHFVDIEFDDMYPRMY